MIKYLLILVVLAGCYSLPKANKQHGRAVSTYPEIGADYCARIYPSRDSLIKGDSVVVLDTLLVGGETISDTVTVKDTVRITKVVQLPGQIITRLVTRVDTVRVENTASLDLCNIEKRQLTAAFEKEQARADKYQGQAKTRLYILIGLILAAIVWGYFKLRKK